MAKRFKIEGNALIIEDTVGDVLLLDVPASSVYYDSEVLNNGSIFIVDRDKNDSIGLNYEVPLADAVTALDVPFTEETFRSWARANLGFNSPQVSGLSLYGTLDYNDLATATTPISVTADVETKLTNDTAGAYTNILYPPPGVTSLWNSTTNQLDFGELSLGDQIEIRMDVEITTTSPSTHVILDTHLGVGQAGEYAIPFGDATFKLAGTYQLTRYTAVYMGNSLTLDNPGEFNIKADANVTVKVNGFALFVRKYA